MRSFPRRVPLSILLVLSLVGGGCAASEAQKAASEGAKLYDRGEYDAALPLLEKAAAKGLNDGQLQYQLAYIYESKGERDKARAAREKAEPLLAKQVQSGKATLEDSYYLTALYRYLQRPTEMKKTAEDGIKKFAPRPDLSGEDLFRLGRLYQFAGNGELSAATYHKAAQAMAGEKDPNAVLYALALSSDAGADLQARRYAEAAEKLEKAKGLNPKAPPSSYQIALAELGAGQLEEARQHFAEVHDPDTASEAQYGADVAARLQKCGGRMEQGADGKPFAEMDNAAVQEALGAAAQSFREAKQVDQGDPAKLQEAERLFFSLAAEWMLRGSSLRDLSLSGNYADLIRR
jgi:Tfp pilus assembly protein PilF